MGNNRRGRRSHRHVFAHILTVLLSIVLSVVLFAAAAFGVLFHCMYEKGGHMLAALLLSYDITEFIPHMYFPADEIDMIEAVYLSAPTEDAGESEEEAAPVLVLAETAATETPAASDSGNVSWTDGIALITTPAPTPVPTPEVTPTPEEVPAAEEAESAPSPTDEPLENPMEYVLIGRVVSEHNVYLRNTPSLSGEGVYRIAPGEWCRILEKHGDFYKIIYEGKEYYIFGTTLHVVKVPVESAPAIEE